MSFKINDIAVGKVAATVADAHTRPVHSMCLCSTLASPSEVVNGWSPEHDTNLNANDYHVSCELFATSSTDNCVKLWDVRDIHKKVRCFTNGHINTRHRTGLAFSPCMRYIASCSEDRSIALYDIRFGSNCMKMYSKRRSQNTILKDLPVSIDLCYQNESSNGESNSLTMAVGCLDGHVELFQQ